MSCRLALEARIPAPWPKPLLRWPAVGVPQAVVSARRYSSVLAHRALIVVVCPSRDRWAVRPAVLRPTLALRWRRGRRSGAGPGRTPADAPPVRGSRARG